MRRYISIVMLFLLAMALNPVCAQADLTHRADGIYHTLQDFLDNKPDTSVTLRKLNYLLPTSQAFKDTLVDHVWFIDKANDRIEKVFAVVYQGELYFHDYGIKQHVAPDYSKQSQLTKHKLHRVLDRGRYFYATRQFYMDNQGTAFMMGYMFGIVGGLAYAAVEGAQPSGVEVEVPLVFDTRTNQFYMLETKYLLKQFMASQHPEYPFDMEKGKIDFAAIRGLFAELNSM